MSTRSVEHPEDDPGYKGVLRLRAEYQDAFDSNKWHCFYGERRIEYCRDDGSCYIEAFSDGRVFLGVNEPEVRLKVTQDLINTLNWVWALAREEPTDSTSH